MRILKRIAFLVVATLVLWYLGHFGFHALWLAFGGGEPFLYSRLLDLALLPVCGVVSWLVLRRLETEPQETEQREAERRESGSG